MTFKEFCIRTGFLLAGMIMLPTIATASDNPVLLVQHRDGTSHQYLLTSGPIITFNAETCSVNGDGFSADFNMEDIEFAKIVDSSAVKEVETEVKIDLRDPNFVTVKGLAPGSELSLYDLFGIRMQSVKADSDGSASIELYGLPSAVYIVNCKETTFKIFKK